MPEYAGGEAKLLSDIGQLVTYPAEAKAAKLEGRVLIKFIITPAGNIEATEISQGIVATPPQVPAAQLLNKEALNAVRNLPGKWKPGRQGGQAVAVVYTIPITFSLK